MLRHALGEDIEAFAAKNAASGVMMIPIPSSGIYGGVSGVEAASATPYVCDITITAKARADDCCNCPKVRVTWALFSRGRKRLHRWSGLCGKRTGG